MASDGYPVQLTASIPLHGSGASSSVGVDRGGKAQPTSGSTATEAASAAAATITAQSIAAAFAAAALAAAASSAKTSDSAQAAPSSGAVHPGGGLNPVAPAAPTAPVPIGSHAAATTAEATTPALKAPVQRAAEPTDSETVSNKDHNDSGRADQFRVDPSNDAMIQQINPANGEVVKQFSIDAFPALTKSIAATGLFVDALA